MPTRYAGEASTTRSNVSKAVFVLMLTISAGLRPSSAHFIGEERFGPYCNALTHACQLTASLAGTIEPHDLTALSQAIARIRQQAADAN